MLTLTSTCNSVSVTWGAPSDPGNPPFDNYTIMLNESDSKVDMKTLNTSQTSYNFAGLMTETKYTVTLTVNSAIFTSEAVQESTSTVPRSKYSALQNEIFKAICIV